MGKGQGGPKRQPNPMAKSLSKSQYRNRIVAPKKGKTAFKRLKKPPEPQ